MAYVTDIFRARWRSGDLVGEARPYMLVKIRRGKFVRRYDVWEGNDVGAIMPYNHTAKPWQAFWTPSEDWRVLPDPAEVNTEQDFDNNGISTATIEIDNVFYDEKTGPGGLFRNILRGFFAPFRGYRGNAILRPDPGVTTNEWYQYLASACQIQVIQGYGDARVETWTGMLEDIDLTAAPDHITITARDFGQVLTDEHCLGDVKDPALHHKPTIFRPNPRKATSSDKTFHEGTAGPRDCSSALPGHPARYVADKSGDDTAWISDNHDSPHFTEWVEVRIPHGRYESFYLHPAYDGMECWVSVLARSKNIHTKEKKCRVDGQYVDDGWLDFGGGDLIPGENGGHHFVKHYPNIGNDAHWHPFGHKLELGDDSIIRVSFRNLREVKVGGQTKYRAGVKRLIGARREHDTTKTKSNAGVILVNDISDVVKVALRWAGFKEWDVEDTGTPLPEDLTFHNGDFLIDLIKKCQDMTNYVFFMADPSGNEGVASIGVPTFRTPNIQSFAAGEQVRDTDVLTGMEAKWSRAGLPEVVYVRGAIPKKGKSGGTALFEDTTKRYQGDYSPPWAKNERNGGVIKHFIQSYNFLKSRAECNVAARMIALNAALQAFIGTIEIPANPGIGLDDVVGVLDTATGVNSRLYVATRSTQFMAGETVSWKMTLGGSLIDNPDVQQVALDLIAASMAATKEATGVAKSSDPKATGGRKHAGVIATG